MVFEPRKWRKSGRLCGESMSDETKRDEKVELRQQGMISENDSSDTQNAASVADRITMPDGEFTGSFSHGIDAKGRMIIPNSMRPLLGDRFVVSPTPDYKAIAIYPLYWLEERKKDLAQLLKKNAKAQVLMDQFSKYSYKDCETDAQGRLLLPQKMRAKYLNAAREVEINGNYDHIRVVSAEQGNLEDESFEKNIPDVLAFMAELQNG